MCSKPQQLGRERVSPAEVQAIEMMPLMELPLLDLPALAGLTPDPQRIQDPVPVFQQVPAAEMEPQLALRPLVSPPSTQALYVAY